MDPINLFGNIWANLEPVMVALLLISIPKTVRTELTGRLLPGLRLINR